MERKRKGLTLAAVVIDRYRRFGIGFFVAVLVFTATILTIAKLQLGGAGAAYAFSEVKGSSPPGDEGQDYNVTSSAGGNYNSNIAEAVSSLDPPGMQVLNSSVDPESNLAAVDPSSETDSSVQTAAKINDTTLGSPSRSTNSSKTANAMVLMDPPSSKPPAAGVKKPTNHTWRPLCDRSNRRIDLCDIDGDVRIAGRNASVTLAGSPEMLSSGGSQWREETWHIKPYPRKADENAMRATTVVTIRSAAYNDSNVPRCIDFLDVPAVIFSDWGYTGNFFHDFTDAILPLFLTARQFNGKVQFLVTNYKEWWIHKYTPVMRKLSKYDIIDFDADEHVRCYPRAMVGLISHDDFCIDPSTAPNNYSMVDFAQFMKDVYGMPRSSFSGIGKPPFRKPRMLIISRKKTRKFANLDEIVHATEKVGFETAVSESNLTTDVGEYGRMVNTFDAMMGVHGAGLTNIVFLPVHAVVIQIVPFGSVDWVARNYFEKPSECMKLSYLGYKILPSESTLADQYPLEHPVFTDVESLEKKGFAAMGSIYLDKQDVRLNVTRFAPVLREALEQLKKYSQ